MVPPRPPDDSYGSYSYGESYGSYSYGESPDLGWGGHGMPDLPGVVPDIPGMFGRPPPPSPSPPQHQATIISRLIRSTSHRFPKAYTEPPFEVPGTDEVGNPLVGASLDVLVRASSRDGRDKLLIRVDAEVASVCTGNWSIDVVPEFEGVHEHLEMVGRRDCIVGYAVEHGRVAPVLAPWRQCTRGLDVLAAAVDGRFVVGFEGTADMGDSCATTANLTLHLYYCGKCGGACG